MLQQYLPFTVLKPNRKIDCNCWLKVATVLTVHGIETAINSIWTNYCIGTVATVLTVHGIETDDQRRIPQVSYHN